MNNHFEIDEKKPLEELHFGTELVILEVLQDTTEFGCVYEGHLESSGQPVLVMRAAPGNLKRMVLPDHRFDRVLFFDRSRQVSVHVISDNSLQQLCAHCHNKRVSPGYPHCSRSCAKRSARGSSTSALCPACGAAATPGFAHCSVACARQSRVRNGFICLFGTFTDDHSTERQCVVLTMENRHSSWCPLQYQFSIGKLKNRDVRYTAASELFEELLCHFFPQCSSEFMVESVRKIQHDILPTLPSCVVGSNQVWFGDLPQVIEALAPHSVTPENRAWRFTDRNTQNVCAPKPSHHGWMANMRSQTNLPGDCFEKIGLAMFPIDSVVACDLVESVGKSKFSKIADIYGREFKVNYVVLNTLKAMRKQQLI